MQHFKDFREVANDCLTLIRMQVDLLEYRQVTSLVSSDESIREMTQEETMQYSASKYYRYEEMMELLRLWAAEYPEILTLSELGTSYEGRSIPLVRMTIGEGCKPAVLLTGNLHSSELIGSCSVLYTIRELLAGSREAGRERAILEDKILYLAPRINVDGAEADLTTDLFCRGSKLPYHAPEDGIVRGDVDGDGVVRQMRRQTSDGGYFASSLNPNVLYKIWPGMPVPEGVTRYDLVSEGYYERVDGTRPERGAEDLSFTEARSPYDIDPNRTFPFEWNGNAMGITYRDAGGAYPLMDCETRALAQFVLAHPEIGMAVDIHSNMGAYLAPVEFCKHLESNREDSELFYSFGDELHEITGYQVRDVFPLEAVRPAPGSYTTWLYYTLGIPAWCAEIGCLKRLYTTREEEAAVGRSMMYMAELSDEETNAEQTRMLIDWDRETYGGRYFRPWHEFDHPQFGTVEIGGWRDTNDINTIWNLPEEYVEDECRLQHEFNLRNIEAAGSLRLDGCTLAPAAGDAAHGTAEIRLVNTGRFPSTKTYHAHEIGTCGTGMLQIAGVKGGIETILLREQLPVVGGGQTVTLTRPLPAARYDRYRISIEGECAGRQQIERTLA